LKSDLNTHFALFEGPSTAGPAVWVLLIVKGCIFVFKCIMGGYGLLSH